MPKIIIKNLGQKALHFDRSGQTVLSIFQSNGQDWMHACGGKGRCTTCSIEVISGGENLDGITDNEQRFMKQGKLLEGIRLACQAVCNGDLEVAAPERYKLPHLSYSD